MFEWSFFVNREDAIYTKAERVSSWTTPPSPVSCRHGEDWKPGDDRNTSAWVRATAPAGSAAMEGRPLWSAELGHGVRPAQHGQSDPYAADYPAQTDLSLRDDLQRPAWYRRQRQAAGTGRFRG